MKASSTSFLGGKERVIKSNPNYQYALGYELPNTQTLIEYLYLLSDINSELAIFNEILTKQPESCSYLATYQLFLQRRSFDEIQKIAQQANINIIKHCFNHIDITCTFPSMLKQYNSNRTAFEIGRNSIAKTDCATQIYERVKAKIFAGFLADIYMPPSWVNKLLDENYFVYIKKSLTLLKSFDLEKCNDATQHLNELISNVLDSGVKLELIMYFEEFYKCPKLIIHLLKSYLEQNEYKKLIECAPYLDSIKDKISTYDFNISKSVIAKYQALLGDDYKAIASYKMVQQKFLESSYIYVLEFANCYKRTEQYDELQKLYNSLSSNEYKYFIRLYSDPRIASEKAVKKGGKYIKTEWAPVYYIHKTACKLNRKIKDKALTEEYANTQFKELRKHFTNEKHILYIANKYELHNWVLKELKKLPTNNSFMTEEKRAILGTILHQPILEKAMDFVLNYKCIYIAKTELLKVMLVALVTEHINNPKVHEELKNIEQHAAEDQELKSMVEQAHFYFELLNVNKKYLESPCSVEWKNYGDNVLVAYISPGNSDEKASTKEPTALKQNELNVEEKEAKINTTACSPGLTDLQLKSLDFNGRKIHDFFQQKKQEFQASTKNQLLFSKHSWKIDDTSIDQELAIDVDVFNGLHYFALINEKKIHCKDSLTLSRFKQALKKGFVDSNVGKNGIKLISSDGQDRVFELKINADRRLYTSKVFVNSSTYEYLIIFDHIGNHQDVENYAAGHCIEYISE